MEYFMKEYEMSELPDRYHFSYLKNLFGYNPFASICKFISLQCYQPKCNAFLLATIENI